MSLDSKYQRDLFLDFIAFLALISLEHFIRLQKLADPNFDAKVYKQKIVKEWLKTHTESSKKWVNNYHEYMKKASVLSETILPSVEDIQEDVNKDLTKVKKMIEQMLFYDGE